MERKPKTAEVERREPVYEPEDTVRFPAAAGLEGAHLDNEGVRETATGYVGPADRQLGVTLLVDQVLVTTTPKLVVHSTAGGQSRGGKRKSVAVFNLGATTIFVAGTEGACLAGFGYPIPSNTGYTWDKEPNGELWIVTTAGSCDVRTMIEQGYLGGDN